MQVTTGAQACQIVQAVYVAALVRLTSVCLSLTSADHQPSINFDLVL